MMLKNTGLSAGMLYPRNERAFATSISSSPRTSTLTLTASPAATLASMRVSLSFFNRSITASILSSGISSALIVAICHLRRFKHQRCERRLFRLERAFFQLSKQTVNFIILHRVQRGFERDLFWQHRNDLPRIVLRRLFQRKVQRAPQRRVGILRRSGVVDLVPRMS